MGREEEARLVARVEKFDSWKPHKAWWDENRLVYLEDIELVERLAGIIENAREFILHGRERACGLTPRYYWISVYQLDGKGKQYRFEVGNGTWSAVVYVDLRLPKLLEIDATGAACFSEYWLFCEVPEVLRGWAKAAKRVYYRAPKVPEIFAYNLAKLYNLPTGKVRLELKVAPIDELTGESEKKAAIIVPEEVYREAVEHANRITGYELEPLELGFYRPRNLKEAEWFTAFIFDLIRRALKLKEEGRKDVEAWL